MYIVNNYTLAVIFCVVTTMSVFVLPTTRILPVFGVVLFMSDNF